MTLAGLRLCVNDPVCAEPPGTRRPMVAFGSSGIIFTHIKEEEAFSAACIDREKLIYASIPKHDNILNCLVITETGIRLPYMQHGNLLEYIRKTSSQLNNQVRHTWICNAANAVAFIHQHSIVHGDISARNFLVPDDLLLRLCDFAGSGIGSDMPPLVTEEDRYRKSPDLPRSYPTNLFAMGCLMYEIMEVIAENYERPVFPSVRGIKYSDVIYQCWMGQYTTARQVLLAFGRARVGYRETVNAESSSAASASNCQVHVLPP
ncbi:kinase-like protein [Aspergillus pseudodeflectus]|uniref:EKC/KEOPS complex subunit BUD32 n=1 Tax=Aspergillus pseudodeflectus TaxID=176178 RepID=A0ABR4K009_9EURO